MASLYVNRTYFNIGAGLSANVFLSKAMSYFRPHSTFHNAMHSSVDLFGNRFIKLFLTYFLIIYQKYTMTPVDSDCRAQI